MTILTRSLFGKTSSLAALACLTLLLGTTPALAAHHRHHKTHHHVTGNGSAAVRDAQRHLSNLGYYHEGVDGKMGAHTGAAIRQFQRDHHLKVDGKLGSKTIRELQFADHHPVYGTHSFSTHETVTSQDVGGATVNPDFATSLNGGTKVVASRFARVDVSEAGGNSNKRYNVNLNGQPILVADGQPSVVGVSPTYDLGDEDAIIFTTFGPDPSGCTFRHHVLALTGQGSKLLDLDNCTRDYQAVAKNGSLFITFPQKDSNSAVGSAWRLEGTSLNKL